MEDSSFFEEIRDEGRRMVGRAVILDVLSIRFGAKTAREFMELVNAIEDVEWLRELHRVAIKCRSINGFRRLAGRKQT